MSLKVKRNKGSKARCHALTTGTREEIAARLTRLTQPFGRVSAADHWMPDGYVDTAEAELHKAHKLVAGSSRAKLSDWWLTPDSPERRTPSFDIASTCTIEGEATVGLLLVEAKAHDEELRKEAAGRREIRVKKGELLSASQEDHQREQHRKIGEAISSTCGNLSEATSLRWSISHTSHYQMANRFAWACKLTELGIPVILVYLGFLDAGEMRTASQTPFADAADWVSTVKEHSDDLFPFEVWNDRWECNGHAFIPLIRSLEIPMIDLGAGQRSR